MSPRGVRYVAGSLGGTFHRVNDSVPAGTDTMFVPVDGQRQATDGQSVAIAIRRASGGGICRNYRRIQLDVRGRQEQLSVPGGRPSTVDHTDAGRRAVRPVGVALAGRTASPLFPPLSEKERDSSCGANPHRATPPRCVAAVIRLDDRPRLMVAFGVLRGRHRPRTPDGSPVDCHGICLVAARVQ